MVSGNFIIEKIGESILSERKTLKYSNIEECTSIRTQYLDLRYIFVVNILPDKEIDEEMVTRHSSKYTCELTYQASQHGKHECRIYKTFK
jgi:hypothetical protein